MLQTILNSYGIAKSENDELFVEATIENFPQKKHMLVQAMLSVNDMFFTSRMNVQSIFWEDVENFFIMNDIRHTDNVIFTGKSGFSQKSDSSLYVFINDSEKTISSEIISAFTFQESLQGITEQSIADGFLMVGRTCRLKRSSLTYLIIQPI